ncbi:restriction endonuclease subunit S [Eikenella corrodens]|uniref:Restriction endonuclease subunit S n=1 Tax=Eikenella corrodens TaxID=539 RepID=A0A3S9SGX8_EIKCO|nr:restriction endonuclease subunit S [Eikenella corrodens]
MGSDSGGVKRFKISELNVLLKRGKSPKYGSSAIQVIKSGQARGYGEFDFKEPFFLADDFVLDERKLQKGDILINSTGVGTAGRVTLFDLDGDFVADSHITIFRTNDKVLPKFALYSLAHIGFKTIEKMANGASGQIELTLSTIGNIAFFVPDLETQKSIIAQINEYEAEIAACEREIQSLPAQRQAVLAKYLN